MQHRGDSSLNPSIYTQYRSGERLALGIAMSRPLRLHVPGLLHHVFARGNDKACIYADDQDYESFLELLADTLLRFDVRCVAYCLVWNHFHLLLVPNEYPISRLLQQLNSAYCQRFNRPQRGDGSGGDRCFSGLRTCGDMSWLLLEPAQARTTSFRPGGVLRKAQ